MRRAFLWREAIGLAVALAAPGGVLAQAAVPEIFVRADKGHCIACHQLPDALARPTLADVGPRLEGARMRELGRARIKAIIDDPLGANPETVMPPFARHRILQPAEIDALVEFLHGLP